MLFGFFFGCKGDREVVSNAKVDDGCTRAAIVVGCTKDACLMGGEEILDRLLGLV